MARLVLSLLGQPTATLDGLPIADFGYDKVRALLAYLAVESHREHSREALAGLLWPEWPDSLAHKSLSQALFRLRRAIADTRAPPPLLLITRDTIGFNPAGDYWLDIAAFGDLAGTYLRSPVSTSLDLPDIERIENGLALYRGPFLQSFSIPDSASFEEWALLQRERLHRQAMELLDCLTVACEGAGQPERALGHARRQLELDSWREESHQQVMRLLARVGRRSEALAQFEACRRLLAQELGVEPGVETLRLYEQIRDGTLEQQFLSSVPLLLRSPPPPHELPPDPTPLVGRVGELAQLAERCANPACRLVTIVGPGGVGKTRLAIQAARDHLERFRDGVFFVDLTPVGSSNLLASAILSAVRIPSEGAVEPDRRLLDYLRDREMLLVLDNFEHLLSPPGESESAGDGAGLLVEILRTAPRVKLLVTSRERLNLRAEWLEPLGGLETPDENLTPRPPPQVGEGGWGIGETQRLEDYSAAALFLGCIRRLQPDYLPEPAEILHIAHICRLLEGMPLGIELAAPWVEKMSIAQIAEELTESLDLLTTTYRDLPERHRSMRGAFDRSWRLLSVRERSLLRQLSVCRGGFTREAAETIVGASVADLSGLAGRSWLRVEPSGRYAMHELIRQYCGEKLEAEHEAEAGETANQVHDRHAAYYAGFLSAQEPDINWRASVMVQIGPEIGNLDAAWQWVIEHGRNEPARGMVMGLYHIALMEGHCYEMVQRFDMAVHRLREREPTDEAIRDQTHLIAVLLLYCQGEMCLLLGLLRRAQSCIELSYMLLSKTKPSQTREEYTLYTRLLDAKLRLMEGKFAETLRLNRDCLAQLRTTDVLVWPYTPEVGTLFIQANACHSLGSVTRFMGQYDAAQRWLRECLAIREGLGEERYRAHGLHTLANLLCAIGHLDEAERLARKGLVLNEAHQDRIGAGQGYGCLGSILRVTGRLAEAQDCFDKSLAIASECGHHGTLVRALNGLGAMALACGDLDEAARRYEESRASFERLGIVGTLFYAASVIGLGNVALARGDLDKANAHFEEALAAPACAAWEKMDAIAGMAEIAARRDDATRAAELLTCVVGHSFTSHETRTRAAHRLAEIEAELPADSRTVTKAEDRAQDLDDLIMELIALRRNDSD